MAMEKLILKSVMHGVDKIPDSWFEKVPGGYFKEKEKEAEKEKNSQNQNKDKKINSKNDSSGGGRDSKRSSRDSRRRSTSDDRRRRRDNRYEDDRYRSDGGRHRDRRNRSSYDGGDDGEEYYRSGDDRRKPRGEKPRRRPRSVDSDRNGYDYGRDGRPRGDDRRGNDQRPDTRGSYNERDRPSTAGSGPPPNPFSPNVWIPTVGAAGVAGGPSPTGAAPATPYSQNNNMPSPTVPSPQTTQPPLSRNAAKPYVPYANIYGAPTQGTPRQTFSPSPLSSNSSKPDTPSQTTSPIAPPPNGYSQNPFAQQAPTAVDAGAGAQYNGQPGFMNQAPDPRYSARRSTGYDENQNPSDQSSPPPSRDKTSKYSDSPSRDSYDSRFDDRRPRGERRDGTGPPKNPAREKYIDANKPLDAQIQPPLSPQGPSNNSRRDSRRGSEYPREGGERRGGKSRREQGYYSD